MRIAARSIAASLLALLTTAGAARAEEYGDLVLTNVVLTPQGGNLWAIDIEYGFALTTIWPTQPVLIRLYENGVPVEDILLGAPPPPNPPEPLSACCLQASNCGWAGLVDCAGACPSGSGAPYRCLRRAIRPATPRPAPPPVPGSVPVLPGRLEAVIDPDGWHTELHDPLRANNRFEIAVPADEIEDFALTDIRLIPYGGGIYGVEVDLRASPSVVAPQQPFVVRLLSSSNPPLDSFIAPGGMQSVTCCMDSGECSAAMGWLAVCATTEACPYTNWYTPYRCRYLASLPMPPPSFTWTPGEVLTAVLDPEGLYREVSGVSADNVISIVVPGGTTFYGTAKTNSVGCVPSMFAVGTASASSPQPFVLGSNQVLPARSGLMFYGFAQQSQPAFGGTILVQFPVRRTPLQLSSGTLGDPGCGGSYAYDFNARIQSGIDPNLQAGVFVATQYWYRDAASSFGIGLSNGAWFQIEP